ncbi:YczE/YyaS/YitT family protein [Ligilactobacillus salivarius]|uniref:Uncharacterized protein n=1 Tax=Ligilactobacillus salivarius TaxID=1624 RepID=A0AAX3X5V1_9LACO|nr:hypothetical protein [Ligilactobacillus salivarius]MBE7387991.1 hypothetical protein [Ligilactobacillus salivarius]MBE7392490.1 hypothetical protein [Ligilactobacillus salivarius]MCI6062286.1 hypothetical protein [Ligilactobacillus salivarius]MDY5291178.1 hypothetical protein [Ligilactobacillus salivarius]PAY36911.1 hypothetical protein A8C54_06230 [Ligilactobacillus salivarius]
MTRLTKKRIMAISGTTLCGCSVGILQDSALGLDLFSCFVTGIANIFGSSYGTFYLIVTSILLLIVIFLKRSYLGYTTLANLLLTGIIADYTLTFLNGFVKAPTYLIRIILLLLLLGLGLMCLAASLYFTAALGVSAYDAIALISADKYRSLPFKYHRVITDGFCVTIGLIFGATVGIGTLITAFFMGPMI